ncbi:hypothetical protein DM860_009333 [Cuscuta australis]|uniref:DUF3444 domain-containing protein n=1 Tax=Cuscuta australis TaxID=267555 RepID=A0A328DBQ9_9ASTE|nr:hypothetical protein DM860_009333 [Cuscuta australis]
MQISFDVVLTPCWCPPRPCATLRPNARLLPCMDVIPMQHVLRYFRGCFTLVLVYGVVVYHVPLITSNAGIIRTFSHEIRWTKGSRGVIRIYPSKGDVWAMYSEWSPEWNELTPDGVVHKYEMVQIVDEFEEDGVAKVVPPVKVHCHRSVFKQHADTTKSVLSQKKRFSGYPTKFFLM